jgi:hypothetical protein
MPRSGVLAIATIALAAMLFTSAPAVAEVGAFARDQATGKYGYSENEPDQSRADAAALKGCGTSSCKVIFRTKPRECGAIAMTEDPKVWGAARRPNRDAAKLAALENCQKQTKEQCTVRADTCNR